MLPNHLFHEIDSKIDQGYEFLNKDKFAEAIALHREAISLIPDPKYLHEISLRAFVALGESFFYSGRDKEALVAFKEAQKGPGGLENPLIYLRIGQAYFELGDLEHAADSLIRAYALDGTDVFDGEDEKYFSFLATQIDM